MLTFKLKAIYDIRDQLFVERFDANSYLYITRAMDYFDMEAKNLMATYLKAFKATAKTKFFIISFYIRLVISHSKKIKK